MCIYNMDRHQPNDLRTWVGPKSIEAHCHSVHMMPSMPVVDLCPNFGNGRHGNESRKNEPGKAKHDSGFWAIIIENCCSGHCPTASVNDRPILMKMKAIDLTNVTFGLVEANFGLVLSLNHVYSTFAIYCNQINEKLPLMRYPMFQEFPFST
jgi:hypothetical protein